MRQGKCTKTFNAPEILITGWRADRPPHKTAGKEKMHRIPQANLSRQ